MKPGEFHRTMNRIHIAIAEAELKKAEQELRKAELETETAKMMRDAVSEAYDEQRKTMKLPDIKGAS